MAYEIVALDGHARAQLCADATELQEQFAAVTSQKTLVEVTALVLPVGVTTGGGHVTYLVDVTPLIDFVHDIREEFGTYPEQMVTYRFDTEEQCRMYVAALTFWSF